MGNDQQAEARAQQAEAAAQQAEIRAQQAEARAQQTEATAQQAVLTTQILRATVLQLQSKEPKPFEDATKKAVDTFNGIIARLKLKYPPDSPKLTVTAASQTEIQLTWEDGTYNADGYIIRRQTANQGFMEIKQLDFRARSFTDTKLSSNTTYDYELVAFNFMGKAVPVIVMATTA